MDRILIGDGSEIVIGSGILPNIPLLPEGEQRRTAAVLTQPAAGRLARNISRSLQATGIACAVRVLPDGEAAKDLRVAEDVYLWLNDLGFTRGDTIVGVGGGALTDMAGFVAATYLRGVEVVHVPTTLLGAVDASIGGKAGVNLGGKNLVGVFHLPSRVVIDTEILAALPERLRRDGLAEALKAGLIGDPDLVDLLESQGAGAAVDEVVRRAVAVKAAIVAEDPTDRGRRAYLNYGHTIGHAVELASPLTHGEAVAVGMVAAGAAAAGLLGFDAQVRQRSVIEALGLPTTAPGADPEEVRRLLVLDKKRDPSGLRMVLLRRVGEPELVRVGPATVDVALAAVGIA